MRHVIGLLWAVNFTVVAIALLYFKKAGTLQFVALLAAALVGGYFIHRADLWIKKVGFAQTADGLSLQFEAAQNKIEAAKNEALDELNKRVTVHEEALAAVIEKARKTREDLERVAEEAVPPLLVLKSQRQVAAKESEHRVLLEFESTKNRPFGTVVFRAEILNDTQATIRGLMVNALGGTYGNHETSENGKAATQEYIPIGNELDLMVLVSAPCRVRISGSHMAEPLEFDIE